MNPTVPFLRVERQASHAVLVLDNPPMNVVSAPLTRALYRALRALETEDSVKALVITGAGNKAFCAGSDIHEIRDLLEPGQVLEHKLIFQNKVFELLHHFPKPTIAALNGFTYGGGLEIAACCDFIIAETQVKLCLPEIKLGLFPSSGGTYRLARRIGAARAKELAFFGEPIDAAQGLAWGLVSRLAEPGQSLAVAQEMAQTLAEKSSASLQKIKSLINRSFDLSEDELISKSLAASDAIFSSKNAHKGVSAFIEKRTAVFE